MKDSVVFVLLICSIQQVWSRLPSKEDLCGLVVDADYQSECLQCFQDAGHISQHPEAVRQCVANFLPPIAAECAVPHPNRRLERIHQTHPGVHHNHTNANLLPNCLKRRMRDLARYLKKEMKFTEQAGEIVKTVVLAKLIPAGGPNMLSAYSQKYILQIPVIRELVEQFASPCLEEYDASDRRLEYRLAEIRDMFDEDSKEDYDDYDDDMGETIKYLQDDFEDEDEYYEPQLRSRSSPRGNGLPYGGTNALSQEIIFGQCVMDALIENDAVMTLIQVISQDEFYYPIPSWWVLPILRYYKDFREALEGDQSG